MSVCFDCAKQHNDSPFRTEICDDCFVWTDLKNAPENMPSKAAIKRLVKAIRHEAKGNGHWLEAEAIDALNAVEKQMRSKE